MRCPLSLPVSLLACAAILTPARAQDDPPEVALPADRLQCLVEYEQTYLDLPRQVLIFYPSLCPAVNREAVARLVENNAGDQTVDTTRLIMLKTDFECLVQKIRAYLETSGEEDGTDTLPVAFILDCP